MIQQIDKGVARRFAEDVFFPVVLLIITMIAVAGSFLGGCAPKPPRSTDGGTQSKLTRVLLVDAGIAVKELHDANLAAYQAARAALRVRYQGKPVDQAFRDEVTRLTKAAEVRESVLGVLADALYAEAARLDADQALGGADLALLARALSLVAGTVTDGSLGLPPLPLPGPLRALLALLPAPPPLSTLPPIPFGPDGGILVVDGGR